MSLRDKLRSRNRNITVLGSDKETENTYGINATSNENKLKVWNDLLKSDRTHVTYATTIIKGAAGQDAGKREHQMMSIFIGDTVEDSISVDIAKRYIDTYDQGGKTDSVVFNEGNYKSHALCNVDRPFNTPVKEEPTMQVFVVERVDTQTGEKIGRYVKMTKAEADEYKTKQSAQYKAGKNTIEGLMNDPAKRAKLEALLSE